MICNGEPDCTVELPANHPTGVCMRCENKRQADVALFLAAIDRYKAGHAAFDLWCSEHGVRDPHE